MTNNRWWNIVTTRGRVHHSLSWSCSVFILFLCDFSRNNELDYAWNEDCLAAGKKAKSWVLRSFSILYSRYRFAMHRAPRDSTSTSSKRFFGVQNSPPRPPPHAWLGLPEGCKAIPCCYQARWSCVQFLHRNNFSCAMFLSQTMHATFSQFAVRFFPTTRT